MPKPVSKLQQVLRQLTTGALAVQVWRALLLVLVVAIAYLALTPAPPKGIDTGWDKANHGLAFASLTVAACFGWGSSFKRLVWSWLALLAFGGGIEIAQLFVPPRSAEWADWLADAVGIALGTLIATLLVRLRQDDQ